MIETTIPGTEVPRTLFNSLGTTILDSPYRHFPVVEQSSIATQISPTRGGLHVLTDPNQPVKILANLGAQFMNAKIYYDEDPSAKEMVAANEESQTATVLAFTNPGDTLIVPLHNELQKPAVDLVKASWERVGIPVATHIEYVSPDQVHSDTNVTPFILSPDALLRAGVPLQETFRHVAGYTKDGPVYAWQEDGVPVPPTFFLQGIELLNGAVHQLQDELGNWERVVINSTNGSGGYGIYDLPTQSLNTIDFPQLFPEIAKVTVQVQPKLELTHSPCVIATINSDGSFQILHMSEQRFKEFGVHGGNVWHADIEDEMIPPGQFEVIHQAVQSLSKRGIRGQINLDFLTLSDVYAEAHNSPNFLVREANIRPAGSSVQIRMRDVEIDGEKVKRIHTKTGLHMPMNLLMDSSFFESIDRLEKKFPQCRIIVYSAHLSESGDAKINVGFVSSVNDEENVTQFESEFIHSIQHQQ
jgi:hypothetical protein